MSIPKPLQTWAKNLTYSTNKVAYPTSTEAAQAIVKKATKIRGLGSRHSFNAIAGSPHYQICPEEMKGQIELDETAKTVTVDNTVN